MDPLGKFIGQIGKLNLIANIMQGWSDEDLAKAESFIAQARALRSNPPKTDDKTEK